MVWSYGNELKYCVIKTDLITEIKKDRNEIKRKHREERNTKTFFSKKAEIKMVEETE